MVAASIVLASEHAAESAHIPGWVFGGFAFVALMALLGVTMMIKQEPHPAKAKK